jgi:hypothetical protein
MFWLDCKYGMSVKVANIVAVSVYENNKKFKLRVYIFDDDYGTLVSEYDDEVSAFTAKQYLMTAIENSLKGEVK